MGDIFESTLSDYKKTFEKFNKYIKKIHNDFSEQNKKHHGYLVDWNKYKELENNVDYLYKNKQVRQNNLDHSIPNQVNNPLKEIESKKLITESFDSIINQISSGKSFIIINEDTYELICKKNLQGINSHLIYYQINPQYLLLYQANNKGIYFKNNKNNIINEIIQVNESKDNNNKNPIPTNSNFEKNANKIFKDTYNYYNNEKYISNKLNEAGTQTFQGYLVNKEWADKWKRYSYYESIKTNFFEKNLTDEKTITNWIIEEQRKTKLNYDDVNDFDNYIIKNENQISEILLPNKPSYILLDTNFFHGFSALKLNPFSFYLSNHLISARLSNGQSSNFKANDNILTNPINFQKQVNLNNSQINKEYKSQLLQYLIRYSFFKQELKSINNSFQNNLHIAFLINKQILNKFNEIYKLEKLLKIQDIQKILQMVSYNNCDTVYPTIVKYINEKMPDYINDIMPYEKIGGCKFDENQNCFIIKYINNQIKLLYIDNFEIIDNQFADFLKQKFGNNILVIPTNFAIIKDKILLLFNFENYHFFEIASLNPNNLETNIDYLIEIKSTGNNFSYEVLYKTIYPIIFQHDIKTLRTPIKIGNNITFQFHPLNNDFTQNIQVNLDKKNENIDLNMNNNDKTNNQASMIPASMNQINSPGNLIPIQSQGIPNTIKEYYLIDEEFFKFISPYLNRIKNNTFNNNQIVNEPNPSPFGNWLNLDLYKIKISQITINNKIFHYPKNINIIDKTLLEKIIQTLNNKVSYGLFEEIYFVIVNGGIIFIPKNNKFIANNNNLIYIYSINSNGQMQSIEPFAIFECQDNNSRNNLFSAIPRVPNYINVIQTPIYLSNGLNHPIFLFKNGVINNNDKGPQTSPLPDKNLQANNLNLNPSFQQTPKGNTQVNNRIDISDKLKVLLLLAISQLNKPENKLEKVHLFNPEWLNAFNFKGIRNLVNSKNNEIRKLWNHNYDLNSISSIIQILDYNTLQKYDSLIKNNPSVPWTAVSELITLVDKQIDLYRKFILVNDSMFNLIQRIFLINPMNDDNSHICLKNQGDLLIFKNHQLYNPQNPNQVQNSILFGNIDKAENEFKNILIFDYHDKTKLEREYLLISSNQISNYIYNKTCLNPQSKYEIFSPIFDNDQIIGNYYLYQKGQDYRKYNIYYQYLNNDQLKKVIYLYLNEASINSRIKNPNYNDAEFYLIKKGVLSEIKTENNYDQLKNSFIGKIKKIPQNNKEIYNIFSSLSSSDLDNLNKNLKKFPIAKGSPQSYEILMDNIKNSKDQNESYMILKDFELVEKNLGNVLISGYPSQLLKCSFIGNNTIIFHYPINIFSNKQPIYVVSRIDEKFNFINEYLLAYSNQGYYQKHFEKIKNNLNGYLKNLSFMNNNAPIVINGYIEIGTVIKLSSTQSYETELQTDDNIIPQFTLLITNIYEDYPSRSMIGLENIGATCYMNATLQSLCTITKLVNYFKYNKHLVEIIKKDTKKQKLCTSFKILIENLYPYQLSKNYQIYISKNPQAKINSKNINIQIRHYAPRHFKDTISRMNPLFEGIAANDAKDLINFILMTLHEELNMSPKNQIDNFSGNMLQVQTNKDIMFKNFSEIFMKNYRSIISDLFYAVNYNCTQCGFCKVISYNYQVYFFLNFPLEEVRKNKLMNNSGFNNGNINIYNANANVVDIYDCFEFDRKMNFMTGQNAMFCNYCKQTCGSLIATYLATGPEILIIILNRGRGIQFNVKINFYLDLDLSNYIELKETGCQYELFGVITHLGESGMEGHFIAYCKNFWNNQWLKFNDAIVSPVNDFKKEVIDFGMPYLLFYQKKQNL